MIHPMAQIMAHIVAGCMSGIIGTATVFISCRYCSSFRGPSRVGFEHRVDGDELFSHARDDSDFLGFSCAHKFLIKGEDDRIVPGRD